MAAAAEQESAGSRLKITEIFFSIQGEAVFSGWPTVFVRLTGCPLRCQYCDTAYAFTGGEWRTFAEIETEIRASRHAVRVRDGRRAARAAALRGAPRRSLRSGFDVSLETSGAHRHLRRRHARGARRRPQDAGIERGAAQPLGEPRAPHAARRREDRDLRSRRLRMGARCARKALVAVPRVFLAELRGAARGQARRLDSRRTVCPCACRCSCTKCSGATCRGADDEPLSGVAVRRARFGDGARDCARARRRVPHAGVRLRPAASRGARRGAARVGIAARRRASRDARVAGRLRRLRAHGQEHRRARAGDGGNSGHVRSGAEHGVSEPGIGVGRGHRRRQDRHRRQRLD